MAKPVAAVAAVALTTTIEASQLYGEESEWIHDWDYKRILPEYTKRRSSGTVFERMSMDIDAAMADPLAPPPSQEMAIFWSRIPKYLSDETSDMSDDEEFHAMDFHELKEDVVAFVPENRRGSSNDLTAFNKPPPFSWDDQQQMDHSMKMDVGSAMSPLQGGPSAALSKYHYPPSAAPTRVVSDETAMNMDGSAQPPPPGAQKWIYPHQLLQDVVKHSRHSHPPQKLPAPPKGQQQQLLKEMRHSYQERRPCQELPTPPEEQRKLMQEMRHNRKKQDSIYNRQQQILQQQLHKTPPRTTSMARAPSPIVALSPPRKEDSSTVSTTMSHCSPISVSEIFSADCSSIHARVCQLTEKNLFQRQQNLLQESMKRTLESRKALLSWPQEYERGDKLLQVLEQVDSTSLKISQTYHLKIRFGAA